MILAGDIGGTKTNLALFAQQGQRLAAVSVERFLSVSYSGAQKIIEAFLDKNGGDVSSVCLAVAGPVVGGRSRLTNLQWSIAEEDLRRHFGWRHVRLLNDVEAAAYSLPLLDSNELAVLQEAAPADGGNMAVVATGTGLGAALVLQRGSRVVPVSSEAGHAGFAPVDEDDCRLWRYVYDRHGRVSRESLLSGAGLHLIYQWRREMARGASSESVDHAIETSDDPAAVISTLALEENAPLCREALDYFVRILGSVAGDLALTWMAAGGVYLAGGIAPKILPILRLPLFRQAFVKKGRFMEFLTKVPVKVVLNEEAPILGAASVAAEAEANA